MTDIQLYLAIGVPILFNAAMLTLVVNLLGHRIDALEKGMSTKFDAVNQRFDDTRDLWRAWLHRVEEVLAARLKHLEEERH